tara:strand:+ start:1575 stop:2600 length:1026 start_codon:yes stop_codon:yes gene_type:complete
MSNNLTYAKSGVNIRSADKFIKFISKLTSKKNKINKNKSNIGNFGSITKIPSNLKNVHLVASTDGVGTKIEIANELKKFDSIGIDLVAMSVNDILVQGAKPFIFLDYISINKISKKKLQDILKGINKGCKISKCELVGGETAEMPGTYSKGKFDIAGFCVGLVEDTKILKQNNIKKDDLVIAIPSSGLHSNGFSLVRYVLSKNKIKFKKNKKLKKWLLEPTKIYVKEITKLIDLKLINGCAHITGGGIKDNLSRVIPKGKCAQINLNKIKVKKVFSWLKKNNISEREMLKTFNCGVGFVLITKSKNFHKIKKYFKKDFAPYVIGKITSGENKVLLNGQINW